MAAISRNCLPLLPERKKLTVGQEKIVFYFHQHAVFYQGILRKILSGDAPLV